MAIESRAAERSKTEGLKSEILNVRAEAARRRGRLERVLARMAGLLANPLFFFGELLFHGLWVVLNTGSVAGVPAWDPYPFPLLTGLASAQALFIGLLILMHTRRDERVDELREETHLQVSLHAERETSRLLAMVESVQRALGVGSEAADPEVQEMKEPLDPGHLSGRTRERLEQAERDGC